MRKEDKNKMERNLRKTRVGRVVSDKMDKTIVVAIEDNVQIGRASCRERV